MNEISEDENNKQVITYGIDFDMLTAYYGEVLDTDVEPFYYRPDDSSKEESVCRYIKDSDKYADKDLEKDQDASEEERSLSVPDFDDDLLFYEEEEKEPFQEYLTPEMALKFSLRNYAEPKMSYLMRATGMSSDMLADRLNLYLDPSACDLMNAEDVWLTDFMYLRGKGYELLEEAKKAHEKYGRYQRNIDLIKKNLPEEIPIEDIHIGLGSRAISDGYLYAEFIAETLHMSYPPKIKYNEAKNRWEIKSMAVPDQKLNREVYGTWDMDALTIFKLTMNMQAIEKKDTVERYNEKGEKKIIKVLNLPKTLLAIEKQALQVAEFKRWILRDPERAQRVHKRYIRGQAGFLRPHFNGDFLELTGKNPNLNLFEHQLIGITRVLFSNNTLLAFDTGSGKSYTIICSGSELKRMGIAKKILYVLPNAILDHFASEWKYAYPNSKVLVIYPEDFNTDKAGYIKKIKEEEYDAILMAMSSYDMFCMSRSYYLTQKDCEIKDCIYKMESTVDQSEKKDWKRKIESLKKEYQHLYLTASTDVTACFDELGIDAIFIDEAHMYKNIKITCNLQNVVGFNGTSAKKCEYNMDKIRFIQKNKGVVVFSTGTPIKNSLTDVYAMMMYLQPDDLEYLKIHTFTDWLAAFCEPEENWEVGIDSVSHRRITRLLFRNIPELIDIFSNCAEFYTADKEILQLPELDDSKTIVVPRSKEQAEFYEELARLLENREINPLAATVWGGMASVDIRLVRPDVVPDTGTTKSAYCAEEAAAIYREAPGTAQLIFCDVSVPKKEGFHVYAELKRELMDRGIPECEIAFIHDATNEAKRRKLFADVNQAKVRILIGSTQKAGVGVNLQEKLVCIHHLDTCWGVADLKQRNARMMRIGNTVKHTKERKYITEKSFDAYMYQLLYNKQKFTAQFTQGTLSKYHRSEWDVSLLVLEYAEIIALAMGNIMLKRHIDTSNALERAKMKEKEYARQLFHMQSQLSDLPKAICDKEALIEAIHSDIDLYKEYHEDFTVTEAAEFGEMILSDIRKNVRIPKERPVDWYQGFEVILPANMTEESPYILLRGAASYSVMLKGATSLTCCKKMEKVLKNLDKRLIQVEEYKKQQRHEYEHAKSMLSKGNPYTEEVEALQKQLEAIEQELEHSAGEKGCA